MPTNYIVIDTNVWIRQFLNPDGVAGAAISKALERYTPVFDSDTLEELRTRLDRPKIAKHGPVTEREVFLARTVEDSVIAERTQEVSRSRDPDDDKFLGLAMTVGAKVIVSGDKHLFEIGRYEGIQILKPEDFLRLEREREKSTGEGLAPKRRPGRNLWDEI